MEVARSLFWREGLWVPPSNSPAFSLALLTPCCSHLKSVVSVEADLFPGWLGQAWPLGILIPLSTTALKPENTRFIPLVRSPRQTGRACPVSREKLGFHWAWNCRGRCWVMRWDSAVVAILFQPHSAWEVAKQEVSSKLLSLLHTGYCLVIL